MIRRELIKGNVWFGNGRQWSFSYYYGLLLLTFLSLWLIAWGGGIWEQSAPWYLQWQHRMFDYLCHQIPARSFWIGGQPMAVCARCFGIYSGLLLGWMTVPWMNRFFSYSMRFATMSVFGAILIIMVDVCLSLLETGYHIHPVRWIYGLVFGATLTLILNKHKENYYHD